MLRPCIFEKMRMAQHCTCYGTGVHCVPKKHSNGSGEGSLPLRPCCSGCSSNAKKPRRFATRYASPGSTPAPLPRQSLRHRGTGQCICTSATSKIIQLGKRRRQTYEIHSVSQLFDHPPKIKFAKMQKHENKIFDEEILLVFCSFFAICRRRRQTRCAHACVSRVKALPRLALAYMYLGLDPCHSGRRECNKVLGERGCPTPSE